MNPGKLRTRIKIIAPNNTKENDVGEYVPDTNEVVYATLWASVDTFHKGKEYLEAEKYKSKMRYKVKTRFYKGITNDMVIKYKDKTLYIENVINLNERNEELLIRCYDKGLDNGSMNH